MSGFSQEQHGLIRKLLHDATLETLALDPNHRTVTARFNCLRRNTDGTNLDDRTVEFKLFGVNAVAAGYDPVHFETRPSQFDLPQRIKLADLVHWPFRRQEALLWINSNMNEEALECAHLDWLSGDRNILRHAPCTFCLTFDSWCDFGMPVIHLYLLLGGDSLTITSGGAPFALDQWQKQFDAWWQGWKEHWDGKHPSDDTIEYDTFIPAGESEPPDPDYQPPQEPVFALETTDAPAEIIRPIRDWFESRHLGKRSEISHDFGRWGYARAIDEWWVEGTRACAVMRGIEHEMPSEGDPAENRESVWSFALRKRDGNWIIHNYSQGWPPFGSAKKLPAEAKPWLKRWKSGEVE